MIPEKDNTFTIKPYKMPLLMSAFFLILGLAVVTAYTYFNAEKERKDLQASISAEIQSKFQSRIYQLLSYTQSYVVYFDMASHPTEEKQAQLSISMPPFMSDRDPIRFFLYATSQNDWFLDKLVEETNVDDRKIRCFQNIAKDSFLMKNRLNVGEIVSDPVLIDDELYLVIGKPVARKNVKFKNDITYNNRPINRQNQFGMFYACFKYSYFTDVIDEIIKLRKNIDLKIAIRSSITGKMIYGDSAVCDDENDNQITTMELRKNSWNVYVEIQSSFMSKMGWNYMLYAFVITLALFIFFLTHHYINQIYGQQSVLMQQRDKLSEANKTKDRFFSIIAHDLRNPLTALINLAEVFAEYYNTMSSNDVMRTIKIFNKSATHMGKLLENLFEWSSSNTGAIQYNPVNTYIVQIANSAFEDVGTQAKYKEIELHIVQNAEDAIAFCDMNMVLTIIRNLVSNAIKFSNNNSNIYLIIDQSSRDANKLQISIKDEGVGMEQDKIDKLFNIGEKVSSKGTNGEAGTGLGLILCKEFIERHNCDIWVESELGKGTQFKFELLKADAL
ncbi:MAG: HAMP domain-containing histidine kinase [Ignavibacteria bacterium]|jgi:signal transduction histidine kinase|nr:HAMP domain-containing histidine kinase [Ignavibacteria bacterium]